MREDCLDLYEGYLKEKEDKKIIRIGNKGFLTYHRNHKHVHVDIIYVKPEHRRDGIGTQLADKLVKQEPNIVGITCAVVAFHKDAISSINAIASYGFEIISANKEQEILLYKDLTKE